MLIQIPSDKYWFDKRAVSISLNALDNPDTIQVYVSGNAVVMACMEGIDGLDYDVSHNYRRWKLTGSPTYFPTHTEKYVYIAIPRAMTSDGSPTGTAMVVFPSEMVDLYGKNEAGVQVYPDRFFYLFTNGIITSSGEDGKTRRDWKRDHDIISGTLHTDYGNDRPADAEWYEYISATSLVKFLKDITMEAGTKFRQLFAHTITLVSGGSIRFGESETAPTITGVADGDTSPTSAQHIATPAYVDYAALSKLHDDKTDFGLEMASLKVNGTADIFGNTILNADALIKGNLTVGTPESPSDTTLHGDLTIGTYNKGISGAHVDLYGNSEFESIVARTFLETPEIRKKRTTITVGNEWQTEGGGIIEQVWTKATVPDGVSTLSSEYDGIAKLKLEPSEPGAIAVDDFCQGTFNFGDGTDSPTTSDTHDGNFHMQGFTTIYFIIKEIYTPQTLPPFLKSYLEANGETPQDNQYFRYELRAATCRDLPITDRNRWTDAHHPTLGMHFAAYANLTIPSRQRSRLKTTSYVIHLAGMRDWTYDQSNIQLIYGWLDGFTVRQNVWNKEKKQYEEVDKQFHGEGIAVGNIYMWGNIDQFDRAPSVIAQQLYYQSTTVPDASPSGILISTDHQHIDYNGWLSTPITPSPTDRYVWQQWLYTYSDGTYDVSKVSLSAADTTTLTVRTDKSLISVAISDFYDTANPDDITFDVTARILSGETPLTITAAEAALADGAHALSSSLSQPSSAAPSPLSYTTEISADSKSVLFHITLNGYLSTSIDGATPEDTFIILTLTSDLGIATSTLTIAQNREGEDGIDGQDGKPGVKGDKGDAGTGIDIKGSALKYYARHTDYFADQKESGIYILDTKDGGTSHGMPVIKLGAFIYTYDAETDTTDITEAVLGDTYYVEDNGHLYVSTGGDQGSVATFVHWTDCGNIKGQDAVLYTLDIPNTILEHLTTFPITVVKTAGPDTAPISYDQATTEGVAVIGEAVEWNAQNQRFHLPAGAVKGTTYTITLMLNGYVINTYSIQCIGNGDRGYVGVTVRRSEWQPGVYYRNDSDDGSADNDGNRYLDEVSITNLATGKAEWFLATRDHNNHLSDLTNQPSSAGSNPYWTKINDLRPLRTPFADITTALIGYLQVSQIILAHQEDAPDGSYHKGDIYGAIGGSEQYPLWFGGDTIDKANAKIGADGSVYFNNGYFNGSIQARNFSQYLTECVAEEYYTDPRFQNFDYDNVRDRFVHSVSEFGGSYYSVCAIDLDSASPRGGSVRHWIVLPCPTAANVGKTYEIIAPNYISQGRIYDGGYKDLQNWPIGVTSFNGNTLPDGETPEWIDPTIPQGADHQHGALVTLWGNRAHFATSPAYTAAILCSNSYATDTPTDDNTSRLRVVCVARELSNGSGTTATYYQWAILESHNVRFTSNDQLTLIDA